MDIKQIRAFLTITETKNITRAANMLNIVQPAVTRQIRLFEEELGVQLFERTRNGMILTNEGRILEPHARNILKEVEKIKMKLTSPSADIMGSINIGVVASISELLSTQIISILKEKFPKINIRITVAYSGLLRDWVEKGDIDFAINYGSQESKFIEIHPLVKENLYLISNQPISVDFNEIEKLPLILPYQPHILRSLIDKTFLDCNIIPNVYVEVNDIHIQKKLVLNGIGFTVLPLITVKNEIQSHKLYAKPILDNLSRTIALSVPNTKQTSKLTQIVVNEVKDIISNLIENEEWIGGEIIDNNFP